MSRATNHLLESLSNNDRTVVDNLPIAGKLLLLQWLAASFAVDISDLGSRLAPLSSRSFTSGEYLYGAPDNHYPAPAESSVAPVHSVPDRFRRGLNIPPETPVEDNG